MAARPMGLISEPISVAFYPTFFSISLTFSLAFEAAESKVRLEVAAAW